MTAGDSPISRPLRRFSDSDLCLLHLSLDVGRLEGDDPIARQGRKLQDRLYEEILAEEQARELSPPRHLKTLIDKCRVWVGD